MQELKKILEEIEKGTHTFELLGRDVDFVAIDWVRDVIRKHMNDGWIPASKPPETGRRCLVKMKHHAWISDYDSNSVLESEKIYHAEYVEICEAIYQDNDRWTYCDLQDGECTAYTNPKEYPGMPIDEVLEWQYMPHLQPETCKHTGGSCCWPIDQCSDCPNNPERSENDQ